MKGVVVVATGVANLASVLAAWRRLGVSAEPTEDPEVVERAPCVQVPGVGSFGAAMEALRRRNLDQAIRARVDAGRPLLAVCVGLQVLAEASEESPGVTGIGVLAGRVTRFPDRVRVPQFGWNQVVTEGEGPLEPGYAYYANSYRLETCPAGWSCAWSDHGGPFVAALWRGRVLATQFHPELSGTWGLSLLDRFVRGTGSIRC